MKLSRKKENRERLLRNLATSLVLHEKITTSAAKAKAVKPLICRLLRSAQSDNLTARRRAAQVLFNTKAVKKLFEDIKDRLLFRNSGQNIKIQRLESRLGDSAPQVKMVLSLRSLEEEILNNENKK